MNFEDFERTWNEFAAKEPTTAVATRVNILPEDNLENGSSKEILDFLKLASKTEDLSTIVPSAEQF